MSRTTRWLALQVLIATVALLTTGCERREVELGHFDYASHPSASHCDAGTRPGASGATPDVHTALGARFSVRTPKNYDATMAHPLIVVFAPSGSSRFASETLTGLTAEATRLGFIVAYADSVRMSVTAIKGLGMIAGEVAKTWCVDAARIYYTGHSDGGTVSLALSTLPDMPVHPAAIAPSAAGFTDADLKEFSCPSPLPVAILHSAQDQHFSGYGREIAKWFAQCNQCDTRLAPTMVNGCAQYAGCQASTQYCEGQGSHATWPDRNSTILKLFLDSPSANRPRSPPD